MSNGGRPEHIVTSLIKCGLSEKEAELFCILNQLGPSNASTLARAARMPRVDVYRILKKLQEKNLVKLSQERPLKFTAISMKKAIYKIIATKKERIERIQQIGDELKTFFRNDISKSTQPVGPKFNIIQGRPQILSKAERMHLSSKKEICIIAPKTAIVRDVAKGMDDILEKCKKTKVKVRVLTNIDNENLESVKRFMQFSEVRYFPLNEMGQLIISDNKEILTIVSASPSPNLNVKDETAIWTNAECYANFQKTIFDELWRDAIDGRERVMQLENIK